jgi:ElaB/YqjD/DUF883 family membrane-anchored ribosome-binding protein
MASALDTEPGSERLWSYESELKSYIASLSQLLDQIPEFTGEQRKKAITQAEHLLSDADERIGEIKLEVQNIPTSSRRQVSARVRNYSTDVDSFKRRLKGLIDNRSAAYGDRYGDDFGGPSDATMAQRQQLLSGTDRLDRTTDRLRDAQRLALQTEETGASTLQELREQRETLSRTHNTLLESEGYLNQSVKTLRGMARR